MDIESWLSALQVKNPKMAIMLESVYSYNIQFVTNKKEEEKLKKILHAMTIADRKVFVPQNIADLAYQDTALHIGHGQTISQPSTVARMLMLLRAEKGNYVLEVGTASGWNACLLALQDCAVETIERIPELAKKAKTNIDLLKERLSKSRMKKYREKLENIVVKQKNFFDIGRKKYDRIIITAGIPDKKVEILVEKKIDELLKNGGVAVCPYTEGPIAVYERINGKLKKRFTQEHYLFVPLLTE